MTRSGRAHRVLLGIGVLVAVQAAAIGLYLLARQPTPVPPFAAELLAPRAAPALAFERQGGGGGALAGLRGKVVMVHFWATWCEPCRDELPGLLALAGQLERAGRFALVAVSVDDEWDEIRRFFDGRVPAAIVRPAAVDAHRRFGAATLPDTYLIDTRGNVVLRYAGARDWRSARARAQVEAAIEKYGETGDAP